MAKRSKQKNRTMVIDTNVFMNDPKCIYNFAEHDVVVAMPVLEELDRNKSGEDLKNYNSREASRILRKFLEGCKNKNSEHSFSLGEGKGNLIFYPFLGYPKISSDTGESIGNIFMEDKADHRIIAIAYACQQNGSDVTLVTEDNNMYLKAMALGINAEVYLHDTVKNLDKLTGPIKEIDPEDLQLPKPADLELYLNQPVMVKGCGDGQNHIYRWDGKSFGHVHRKEIGKTGIKSKNLEQDFAVDILMDPSIELVALIGSAGSGKTLLATACALAQRNRYNRILVGRPAVELGNKTMGYLPGNLKEKYAPYMAPFISMCRFIMDNMGENDKETDVEKWMLDHSMDLLEINVIRGNTFPKSFIIVDEAQNLSRTDAKTIVSRAGIGSKIVFTGDINQIDVPYLSKRNNGISHVINGLRDQSRFAYIEMQHSLRSPLAELADKLL